VPQNRQVGNSAHALAFARYHSINDTPLASTATSPSLGA
jgi:hypothetical protein